MSSAATPPPPRHHHVAAFRSRLLGNARPVEVYLPPGQRAPERLLVLNDGQDAGAIGLSATLARLHAERRIAPTAVIAVHARERLQEYGTIGVANAGGLGRRAGAYRRFLIEELLPALAPRYGVDLAPERCAIAGFSLGGLAAVDLAWSHPEQFSAAGAFSGSFWWRTDERSVHARVSSRIMHRKVRDAARAPMLRIWLQAGTEDETADRDGDGVIDAIQDTTELIDALAARGYRRGHDVVYREVQGGRHDQATWGAVLPEFLTWLWPAE